MNTAVKKLAMFVRDVLDLDESIIRVGRKNFRRDDFTSLQIVVDSLGAQRRLSRSNKYDGVAESMTYSQKWEAPCTIDFYGDGAFEIAQMFSLMIDTELARYTQNVLGVSIYETSILTDVKMMTGEQYSERYQLGLNVQYNSNLSISTGRVDTFVMDTILVDSYETAISIIYDSDIISDDTVISDDTIMGSGGSVVTDQTVIQDSTILEDSTIMGV